MLRPSKTPFLLAGLTGVTLLAAMAMFALAQSPKAQPPTPIQDDEAKFSVETNLVPLHASVVDKSGKLLTNIPRTAFHVLENGAEQTIKEFRREDVPVSMGIIIDNSGSM